MDQLHAFLYQLIYMLLYTKQLHAFLKLIDYMLYNPYIMVHSCLKWLVVIVQFSAITLVLLPCFACTNVLQLFSSDLRRRKYWNNSHRKDNYYNPAFQTCSAFAFFVLAFFVLSYYFNFFSAFPPRFEQHYLKVSEKLDEMPDVHS